MGSLLQLLYFVNRNITEIVPAMQPVCGKAGLLIKLEKVSPTVFKQAGQGEIPVTVGWVLCPTEGGGGEKRS